MKNLQAEEINLLHALGEYSEGTTYLPPGTAGGLSYRWRSGKTAKAFKFGKAKRDADQRRTADPPR